MAFSHVKVLVGKEVIQLKANGKGGEILRGFIRYLCDDCNEPLCNFCKDYDCNDNKYKAAVALRLTVNTSLSILEQTILAHACAGVDVESEAYREGLLKVYDMIGNLI